MDGSKRKSDAAATRKRRSSILKSQRAPRTPFSELEFNVATPTDAKSRRVSFSRRNGVAEFEITEATTAWKNVYEEHNKSLESSVNDSDAKGERRPLVPHLSSRTGLMFEDVEADVIVASSRELATSFGGAPEHTGDDQSASAPRRQFDLSECTHQRTEQLFGEDPNPSMKENTGQIDLTFSSIMPLSDQDLDMIQDRKSNRMSYIDADLNETHISLKGNDSEVSDMSITDTIHSPKVAATKVKSDGKDWVVDKENVIVNPYVAPLPAENFAVADDDDDVLVFDGKKCKFQSDLNSEPEPVKAPVNTSSNKRRTIVYNDDDGDISVTQAVSAQIIIPPKNLNSTRTNATVFESNISMTEVIPSNMVISSKQDEKQQTIHFNDMADITVTETVPSRLLDDKKEQRRKTIVYDADEGQISMTEAVPANIFVSEIPERRKTILYQDDEGDISVTQAVPVNIIQTNNQMVENKTIVYDDASELEMTQAVPVNVLLMNKSEKRKTLHFENCDGNMSITQAIPTNIVRPAGSNVIETNINCENNDNVQLNSTNFEARLQKLRSRVIESQESIVADVNRLCSEGRLIETDKEASSKRRTIVFNDDQGNVSITQPLPSNIFNPVSVINMSADCVETIADITEAVPANIIIDPTKEANEKEKSVIRDPLPSGATVPDIIEDISINKTAVIDKDITITSQLHHSATTHSMTVPNEYGDKSITQAFSNMSNKNNTLSNNDICNISTTNLTNPIPAQMTFIESDLMSKTKDEKLDADNSIHTLDTCNPGPQSIIVYEATVTLEKNNETVNNSPEFSSNEAESSPSDAGTPQNAPEPMDDGNIGDSSSASNESIVKIGDVSSTKVTEEVKPNVVQSSVLNDLLDVSMHSFKSENKVAFDETTKVEENKPLDEIREVSSTKAMEEDKPNVPASVNEWLEMPMMEILDVSSTKVAEVKPIVVQASVLNDLLDMSHASMDDEQEQANKIDTSMKNSPPPSLRNLSIKNKESQDTYLIIKDSDSEPLQDSDSRKSLTHQPLPIEFEHDKPTVVDELKAGLGKLKQFINFKQARRPSKSPDKNKTEPTHETIASTPPSKKEANKTTTDANDTKGILDILSQLTESRISNNFTHEDDKEMGPMGTLSPALENLAIEDKTDCTRARRSMVPDRKSMVRSREDLLKDISMAQAMLDDKEEEPEDIADDTELEASLEHTNNDVVKKLRFDDEESLREVQSPLKKTAFLEAAHSPDGKAKVIPEYLTFTNDLKDLMNDLTKPMADANDRSRGERQELCPCKSVSTCSTQIQANLLTSSQIDLMPEQDSSESMEPLQIISAVAAYGNNAITHALHNDMSETDSSYAGMRAVSHDPGRHSPSTDRVVIFDHSNPLNNVLLPPIEDSDVHGYNPRLSTASLSVSAKSATTLIPESQRNVESRLVLEQLDVPFGEAFSESVRHSIGHTANRKPPCVDQSVDAAHLNLKDSEVNTVIAMKRKHELLDASSSLTLVDDTMESSNDSYPPSPEKERSRSPEKQRSPSPQKEHSVRVLYQVAEDLAQISDMQNLPDDESTMQAKKRVYSPANRGNKHSTFAQDVTPKPASKIQKVSDSPSSCINSAKSNFSEIKTTARKQLDTTVAQNDVSNRVLETSPRKSIFERSETLCMAHELVTELDICKKELLTTLPEQIPPTLSSQSEMSEKSLSNLLAKSKSGVSDSSYLEVVSSCGGSPDRQAGLCRPDALNETSSKDLAPECDSGVNVVAKIDVLPFMGTTECEWETHGLDTWLIKLLRRRVRLLVRLEHRHGNAARTHVRADTPVAAAAVQPVRHDGDDPIPAICVHFATEAIRHVVAAGCRRAGDVPALLRRCVAVARVALRWARAMHAAHAHLAFTLQPDGRVSLKVANIPLRSVWEVTMRIELVSQRDEPPTPQVVEARAARVVSEHAVPPAELARLLAPLPRDWGHAPRAIWAIFKYLKHKKADDELIVIQSKQNLETRVH